MVRRDDVVCPFAPAIIELLYILYANEFLVWVIFEPLRIVSATLIGIVVGQQLSCYDSSVT